MMDIDKAPAGRKRKNSLKAKVVILSSLDDMEIISIDRLNNLHGIIMSGSYMFLLFML